jgi:transcription termination factor Rho
MNLTELKEKSISELVSLAEEMKLENLARTRKQDIIFAILKSHAKSGEDIFGSLILLIWQVLTIFMSRPARFAALVCVPAILLAVKFARPKTVNVTLHC